MEFEEVNLRLKSALQPCRYVVTETERFMSSLRIVIVCALALMILSIATAQEQSSSDGSFLDIRTGSVSIPLTSLKRPAADLVDASGSVIDTMDAVRRAESGQDLTDFNPQQNKIWQNRVYSALERPLTDYPDGEVGVNMLSVEADGLPYTSFYRVQAAGNAKQFWRLGVSLLSQSTTMRSVMLRKLGYDVVTSRAYSRLRVNFSTIQDKENFLEDLKSKDINLVTRGGLLENQPNSKSLVLADAVLETQRNESIDWHWGFIQNVNSPDFEIRSQAVSWVEYMSKFRAYRALIVPFTLVFIPESINRYSPKNASLINDYAIFYHPLAGGFAAATREDVKWLLNRMGSWTEKDFREVVSYAHYPASIKEIIYRKLVSRTRQTFEIFKMQIPAHFPQINLNYTSPDGVVVSGRVVKEKIAGYPQRFTHGDRQSPFKDDDWFRYAGIRVNSSLISSVLGKMEEKLQLLKMDSSAEKFQKDVVTKIVDRIRNNPKSPLEKGIQSWGGPLFGFGVNATRQVATGTYYGSTAAVQLVDNISVSANLGYFNTFEKMPLPAFTADFKPIIQRQYPLSVLSSNLSIQRNYVHVRPLYSMKDATKVSWKDLIVPLKMSNLAKTIDSKNIQDFRDFINNFKEGEVFTITDSVVAGVGGQLLTTFDFLMGMEPLNFINNISLGADASRIVLRQTSFTRSSQGIQIYLRNQTSNAAGLNLDANYFINLMRLRAQGTQTEIKSDAFVIDYKPGWQEDKLSTEETDKAETKEKNLRDAMKGLLRNHSTENLYTNFGYQKLEVEHILKTKETKAKFLWAQLIDMNEDHQVKIRPPRSEDDPDRNPKDDEVTLFRNRRGTLVGMDLLGFATSTIQALINYKSKKFDVNLGGSDDPNPANVPFGKAYWRQVVTEKDFSGRVGDVSIIQHVWGGWKMKREAFIKLIDQVVEQLGLPSEAKYRLIEKESFQNVSGIDFYRITANLSIRSSGVDRVRDLLLQPNEPKTSGAKHILLSRLFQKLSEKISGVKSRNTDKLVLEDIMRIMGNGDLNIGRRHYDNLCESYKMEKSREDGNTDTGHWINGSFFECLTPWVEKLLSLSTQYPKDNSAKGMKSKVRWMTEVVYLIEENIPMPLLLKYLGEENVLYLVQVNGFRSGDEDGDLAYISNTWGKPQDDFEEANGIFQFYARKTGLNSTEIDRTQGSFR